MPEKNHLEPVLEADSPATQMTVGSHSHVTAVRPTRTRRVARRAPEPELNLRFVFSVIEQWWKIATPIALTLAVISAGLVLYLFQPVYEAVAWLQIEDKAPYIAFEEKEESQRFVETQVELLQSPLVLGPVLSNPEVAAIEEIRASGDPLDLLSREIEVQSVGDSELFKVSWSAQNPHHAALLVNGLIDTYFKLRAQDDIERSKRVIELLEEEKSQRAHDLSRQRENVRRLSKQMLESNPLSTASSSDIIVMDNPLKQLRERLTKAEVDRKVMEAEIKAIQESQDSREVAVPDVMVEMQVDEAPEIRDARALWATKRAMMHRIETASAHGANDPAYRRLAREVERYEQMIEDAREDVRPRMREKLKTMAVMEQEHEFVTLQGSLERQRIMEELLRERYEQQLQEIGKTGGQALDLEFARAELAREEEVFDMIAKRATSLRTEIGAPGRVTLKKRAAPPLAPVEEVPWKYLALSILASVCLPFGIAALWERSVSRITCAEELEQQSDLSVVGEVSRLPLRRRQAANGTSREFGRDMGLFEESIDSLRTGLVLAEEREGVQVLAVASAVSGEGKTSVASQLAVSIARSSAKPTLLIDADLRRPDIHRIFQIPNDVGLAQVLDQEASLEDAIVTTWSDHIHLLPAGELQKSPHKLFGSESFKSLLEEARLWYRYVVIDTPPVLSAAESLVIAKQADGTLLCTMRDISRAGHVRLAYDRLLSTGARPVGAVLNGVPVRRYASTYGSYSYQR